VQTFNSGDMSAMALVLSDNLSHRTHPLSLGRSVRGKQEYLDLLQGYGNWLQITVHEINEGSGQVWLHGSGKGIPPCGGTYENEYVHMVKIVNDEAGDPKIVEIKEFMDSVAINTLMMRMQPHRATSSNHENASITRVLSELYSTVVARLWHSTK